MPFDISSVALVKWNGITCTWCFLSPVFLVSQNGTISRGVSHESKMKKKKSNPKEHRFDGSIRTRHPRTKSKSYRPQIGNWKICVVVDRQNRKIKIETNWMFSVSSCELLLRLWATFKLFSLFAFCFFFFLFFFISASCITNVYVPWMDVRVPPNVLCHCHTIGLWGFEWVSVFVVRNVCI